MLDGEIHLDRAAVHEAVFSLVEVWQDKVIKLRELRSGQGGWFPFSDRWDLSDDAGHRARLDKVMPQLAREGHKLFRLLFHTGDQGLIEIAAALASCLREEEQVVTITSDDLFAPWWMLYLPETDDIDLDEEGAQWNWQGFWGYNHLIEHTFARIPKPSTCLSIHDGPAIAGVNVDLNLDEEYYETPCVGPVISMFEDVCDRHLRTTKQRLARDMKAPGFNDQIIYFGCHGVGITHAFAPGQSQLKLTDQDPIRTTDFTSWLNQNPLRHNPLVFVNACQGGQMSSLFYQAFGRELLARGASCLFGPHVDVPAVFSREYAKAFFEKMLRKGAQAGDVVREITRESADDRGNPLGLAFAMYRGMDMHFCGG
ncbi:hypothetical protein [Streptomyces europaeiscabiei]|uniref:hypothetical protein n=1 Tax=Streptomyces europaeiscabiei TaxID=146819 RepID=UPI002E25DC4A|nr:CHAT domain-containing protein [Streptomyces europaeiscabiei]